jgi:hypothetical protein
MASGDTLQVLLRALRDFNLGKLTADDTSIFVGLLNDLFPKTLELVPRAIDHVFEAKVRTDPTSAVVECLAVRCTSPVHNHKNPAASQPCPPAGPWPMEHKLGHARMNYCRTGARGGCGPRLPA